jgi:1-deoxy-D-xylulose-5-phosphate reductoisomerase
MNPPITPPRQRNVAILGCTGSIGQSALKVAADLPERMRVTALAALRSTDTFLEQVRFWKPEAAALVDPKAAATARTALAGHPTPVLDGPEALTTLATLPSVDLVLIAIVGTAGLHPALAAIEAGKDIAVASKEILVMAGGIVMEAARRKGVQVLPVDSEHNAIFQCLEGRPASHIQRLILTASGGPFRKTPAEELARVTPAQALRHPTWTMGRKITVDSATLFNKGLEMIEARWLFQVEMDRVDVVVHPQSIVHSMVEFVDGSVLAQLSTTDMCFPIQYAVTWPDRLANRLQPLDFPALAKLEFEAPRHLDFPALNLARHAGASGGTYPAVLNAANEVAVERFLSGQCSFPAIWETVDRVLQAHTPCHEPSLDALIQADHDARRSATTVLDS